MQPLQDIQKLFRKYANKPYGEDVSQVQHAVQVAQLAEQHNASEALIAAGLLHDIGHLLYNDEMASLGINDRHEILGAKLLERLFGSDVTEPIKLHVIAKRYLCSMDRKYYDDLSDASRESLQLQGGLLDHNQAKTFENNPYFRQAIDLRYWDDRGKDTQHQDTDFEHYLPLLKELQTAKLTN